MQITEQYLNRFATKPAKPTEIPLNGYEQGATHAISIDDGQETCLGVTYRDDYTMEEQWDVKEGRDKRETFVIPRRGNDPVGTVGYRFSGLIKLMDLRDWYRKKEGVKDESETPVIEGEVIPPPAD